MLDITYPNQHNISINSSFFLSWLNIDHFNAEQKSRIGGDLASHGPIAISIVRWANQVCFGSLGQADKTFIPALDHFPTSHREWKRLATVIAGIELCAIDKSALVMSMHFVAFLQFVAFTFLSHCNLEFASVDRRLNFLWFFLLLGRLNIDHFNAEKQRRVSRDLVSHGPIAISVVRWANQVCFGTFG